MPEIHEVVWDNGEIGIVQVNNDLLVCHVECPDRAGEGFWMMTGGQDGSGHWHCAGSSCGYRMENGATTNNRLRIPDAKNIGWWVATWADVYASQVQVEVSIDDE